MGCVNHFAFFVISKDILCHKSAELGKTLKRLIKNLILLSIIFAVLFDFSELPLIGTVKTALEFLSARTASITLFALRVILSAHSLGPRKTIRLVPAIKFLAYPHWFLCLCYRASGQRTGHNCLF